MVELSNKEYKGFRSRLKVQGALQDSEKKYRLIFESAQEGMVVLDVRGKILEANPKAIEISGLKREEVLGKNFVELLPFVRLDAKSILANFKDLVLGKDFSEREWTLTNRKGERITFLAHHSFIRESNKILGLLVILEDVTERRLVEKAIRTEKEKLGSYFEIMIDGIVVNDEKGKMIEVNKAMAQMFGYKLPKKMIGKDIFSNIVEREKPRISKLFDETQKKKESEIKNLEVICRKEDGSEFTVMFNIRHKWDKDKYLGSISVARDITQCRGAEQALRESEEKWRSLAVTAPAVILTLDRDGIIQFLNRTVGAYTPEGAIGTSVYDYVPPEHHDILRKSIERVLQTGRPDSYEILGAGPNGPATAWYQSHLGPILAEGGVTGVTLISIDITERKQMEKMLEKQKEALEQKNVALREIIGQIEAEKNKLKEDVRANVEESMLPILKKLRLNGASRKYLDLLRRNLGDLTSSFGRKITQKRINLTPREIEICDMIKGGLASKEISELLNVSHQTIEKHRKNIRQKLRISNKSINLFSFLQQL